MCSDIIVLRRTNSYIHDYKNGTSENFQYTPAVQNGTHVVCTILTYMMLPLLCILNIK